MAILKFGPIVTGARGTIAGSIFSANQSGPYARAWSKPANQRSPKQTTARAALSAYAQIWRTLTPVQRAAWDAFAALPAQDRINSLGETYSISGFNWHLKINAQLVLMGRPTVVAPPIQVRPTIMTLDTIDIRTGTFFDSVLFMIFNTWLPDYDGIIRIAPAPSVGLRLQTTHYLITWVSQNPPFPFVNLQAGLEAAYGDILVGTVWHASVQRQTTDGLISPPEFMSDTAKD